MLGSIAFTRTDTIKKTTYTFGGLHLNAYIQSKLLLIPNYSPFRLRLQYLHPRKMPVQML